MSKICYKKNLIIKKKKKISLVASNKGTKLMSGLFFYLDFTKNKTVNSEIDIRVISKSNKT